MSLDRRTFLRGALTVAAVAALPAGVLAETLPVLTGDGIADDTDAINAMIRGLPFRTVDGFVGTAEKSILEGATIRVNGTVVVDRASFLAIRFCKIYVGKHDDGDNRPRFCIKNSSILELRDNKIIFEDDRIRRNA